MHLNEVGILIISILQMRELRLREVKGKVVWGSEGGRSCRAGPRKWVLGDPGFTGLQLSDACRSLRVRICPGLTSITLL